MPASVKVFYLLLIISMPVCTFAQFDPNNFDPGNAAHWYYKAFALYEEPDSDDIDLYGYINGEIELTPEIEQFLLKQQPVIDHVIKAASMEYCDWNFEPFEDPNNWINPVLSQARKISYLLIADAYLRKENIPGVIDRIDTVFELSQKIDSGEAISHLTSLSIRSLNYSFIRNLLNNNTEIEFNVLLQIQELLQKDSQRKYTDYIKHLDFNIATARRFLSEPKKYLTTYDSRYLGFLNPAENKIAAEFYRKNFICFKEYTERFQKASQLAYPLAYEQMKQIEKEFQEKRTKFVERFQGLPNDYKATQADCDYTQQYNFIYTVLNNINPLAGSIDISLFTLQTRMQSEINALNAGLMVLIKFREKQVLPNTLGPEYPKDPFSDKPFLLIKKQDSFILKCQGVERGSFFQEDKYNEYEFNLRYRPDWNKKESDVYDPNNASHWYQKGAELLPSESFSQDTEEAIYQLVQNEVGKEINKEFLAVLFDEEVGDSAVASRVDLDAFLKGRNGSSQALRDYVCEHQTAIEYYLKGASLKYCEWNTEKTVSVSDEMGVMFNSLLAAVQYSHLLQAMQLIEADALIKAEKGDSKTALDNVLAIFDIIKHYNLRAKTKLSWYYCSAFNGMDEGVLRIIPYIESQRINLLKLQSELVYFSREMQNADRIFRNETYETSVKFQGNSPEIFGTSALELMKQEFLKDMNIDRASSNRIEIRNYDSNRVQAIYQKSREMLVKAVEKTSIYYLPEIINKTNHELSSRAISIDKDKLVLDINCLVPINLVDHWRSSYHTYMKTKANIHACQAAVEVALVKSRTGQYPDELPASAPLDPFSGLPFDYTKIDKGFKLRSKILDPIQKIHHEWIIAKPND